MKVIHADHERRYDIPSVPGPARRPVDIDTSITGFKRLRSLRLYRFSPGAPIDGHAEEDEVFVIVTAGTAEMKIGWDDAAPDSIGTFTLSTFTEAGSDPSVAYLPPQSVYKLTPLTEVDVAYARATPTEHREPKVFHVEAGSGAAGIATLFHQQTHAQHLRLTLSQVSTAQHSTSIDLSESANAASETLVHVQSASSGNIGTLSSDAGESAMLESWDTVALSGGEEATLHICSGETFSMLMVSAE